MFRVNCSLPHVFILSATMVACGQASFQPSAPKSAATADATPAASVDTTTGSSVNTGSVQQSSSGKTDTGASGASSGPGTATGATGAASGGTATPPVVTKLCNQDLAVMLVIDVSKSMSEQDGANGQSGNSGGYPNGGNSGGYPNGGNSGGYPNGGTSTHYNAAAPGTPASGTSKIEIAIAAAQSFVTSFGKKQADMVGVVSFSDTAALVQPLTTDMQAVQTALGQLAVENSTNMCAGLDLAAQQFDTLPLTPSYAKVIIFISDGDNTFPSDPVADAQTLKQNNVTILTMGYDQDQGKSTLQAMASDPTYYSDSVNGAALQANLQKVAQTLCR